MKPLISALFVILLLNISLAYSQSKVIPSVEVKSINGKTVNTNTFIKHDRPLLIIFFAICCSPSLNALEDIHEAADDLIDEHDLKIILISVDDTRNSKKVAPLLKSKGFDYDIYLDQNGDFRRAMGVIDRPHYILFDSAGNSIFEKTGYMPGIVEEIVSALEGNNNDE